MTTLLIEDLPDLETLTDEELAEIFGAGRMPYRRLLFQSLEGRQLFSASPLQSSPSANRAAEQIVVIDPSVQDAKSLLAAPVKGQVVMLDAHHDGVQQIADYLKGHAGIEAIDVVSHGEAGAVLLGNTLLDRTTAMGQDADALRAIGKALAAGADLELFGCDVAQGTDGRAFIDEIAQLTGANVAASTNLTGATKLGGDWTLEATTGGPTTHAVPFAADALAAYPDVLIATAPIAPGIMSGGGHQFRLVNQTVFEYSSSTAKWTTISGHDIQAAGVTSHGTVYALADNHTVYKYSGSGTKWVAISGNDVQSLAVTSSGAYALATNHIVYQYPGTGTKWTAVSGHDVQTISATSTDVYALATNHVVYHYPGSGTKWTAISGNDVQTLATTSSGAYALASNHVVYHYPGSGTQWTSISGSDIQTLATTMTDVYALSNNHAVLRYPGSGSTWNTISGGDIQTLVTTPINVYALTTNHVALRYPGSGGTWNTISGGDVQSIASLGGSVVGINSRHQVIQYSNSGTSWTEIGQNAMVASDSSIWYVGLTSVDKTGDRDVFQLTTAGLAISFATTASIGAAWLGDQGIGLSKSPVVQGNGFVHQDFERGVIYWSSATGAHIIEGKPTDSTTNWGKFANYGEGYEKTLGLPTTDKLQFSGFTIQHFQYGMILSSSASGTHVIMGKESGTFGNYFVNHGEGLGLPTSDVITGNGFTYQNFQDGVIYSGPKGPHAILGHPNDASTFWGQFAHQDYERGVGLPISDAIHTGVLTYQKFEKGVIYSSPTGGTHVMTSSPVPGLNVQDAADAIANALKSETQMLSALKTELARWNSGDIAHFKTWFYVDPIWNPNAPGIHYTLDDARAIISERVDSMLNLVNVTTFANFRSDAADAGDYAHVTSRDSRHVIYLSPLFTSAPATGEDSKAGTLTHEMSHFNDIGGTLDYAYGRQDCLQLVQLPEAAYSLFNADTFEYYAETGQV